MIVVGMVVGLDYHQADLDIHVLLQRLKLHPHFRPYSKVGNWWSGERRRFPRGILLAPGTAIG